MKNLDNWQFMENECVAFRLVLCVNAMGNQQIISYFIAQLLQICDLLYWVYWGLLGDVDVYYSIVSLSARLYWHRRL